MPKIEKIEFVPKGICPFIKHPCRKEDCTMWDCYSCEYDDETDEIEIEYYGCVIKEKILKV